MYVCDCVVHWFSFISVCANSRLVVRIKLVDCDLTEANCTAALSDSSPLCPLVTE